MREIRQVLYNLEKRYAQNITIRHRDGYAFNTVTGVKTWSTDTAQVVKAIVLDGNLIRATALIGLPGFANYGGEFNATRRLVIIDAQRYPTALKIDTHYIICEIFGANSRFNIVEMDYYSLMQAWLLKIEKSEEPVDNIVNINVTEHLDINEAMSVISSTG